MIKNIFLLLLLIILKQNSLAQFEENILSKPGHFVLGCNYWASNAGTKMWVDWKPEVIEQDFKRMSELGIDVLRIFPIWRDFQPMIAIRNASSKTIEYRFGESPLPDDRFGDAGVSEEMINRLKLLLDLGAKYNLKFIVSLLTGHMSGRIFISPAFDGQNPLTDPVVIQWEIKYLKCLINELKTYPAIVGWGLGNETNCMAIGEISRAQAYTWSSIVANTIRSCDNTRPILSDMHSLCPEGPWSMIDQGELTDILTTHPYPLFTSYCNLDPINTIRPIIHGTAESRLYSDIGNKPSLAEEMGTLGPMISSNNVAADYFRTCMFSLWANDCHGAMWWCNSDFTNLKQVPYDFYSIEQELGLFKTDGSPKPIVEEIKKFKTFYNSFPYPDLPQIKTDAICILTREQNQWANAFSTYILSKQAGFNLEFQYSTQKIKDSQLYLLPGLNSFTSISNYRMEELLLKVKNGATLYISLDEGLLANFEALTGIRVVVRETHKNSITFSLYDNKFTVPANVHYQFESIGAKIISAEIDGNPVFSVNNYGKGKIYLLTVPLENYLSNTSGCFHTSIASPYWKIYYEIGKDVLASHIISKKQPLLAITEHAIGQNKCIAIIINMSSNRITDKLTFKTGWKVNKTYYGKMVSNANSLSVEIDRNDAIILELFKTIDNTN
jgi:endo-1,4-beta-mannosidase